MKTKLQCNKVYFFFLALAALNMMNSCSYPHMYHSPNMMTVPMFTGKGEVNLMPAASFGTVNPSFEMQAAFALPGHIALGGNFMTGGKDKSGASYIDKQNYHYLEGFGGFYSSFNDIGVFEIYAGYGEGRGTHTFAYNDFWGSGWIQDGTADVRFNRFFIQPDVGIRTGTIEGAFSIRLSRVNFKDIKYSDTDYRLDELTDLQQNHISCLIEPGFTFRVGHDPLKFQIQVLFSPNISNPDQPYEHLRFNMGINFRLGGKRNPASGGEHQE